MKVCEKVQAKGLTSYNEVADELVSELTDPRSVLYRGQSYNFFTPKDGVKESA
jgi:hypothetical protein